MNGTIPVQITQVGSLLDAVCTQCGKCAKGRVSGDSADGGPKTRLKFAKQALLAELTASCEKQLPWGIPPVHVDRVVPAGVEILVEDAQGQRHALTVDDRLNLSTVVGGCEIAAAVLVVPESDDCRDIAEEFASRLVKRGYLKARTTAPARRERKATVSS